MSEFGHIDAASIELKAEMAEQLEKHDLAVIRSMQTDWGPVMAGLSGSESDPYNRVWIRDNALIAISLETAGEHELAVEITEGLLLLMERDLSKIRQVIQEGKPLDHRNVSLIHPVYTTNGKELDTEWAWRQNDAIGNLLQAAGILGLAEHHKEVVSELVTYLEVVKYWEKDDGIWEWWQQEQVNTDLSCTAGLKAVADFVDVPDALIQKGYDAVSMLEGKSSSEKFLDLSHLNPFMLGELADTKIIEEIEHELLRDHGVIRYHGDHYMSGGENREAEWVLGLLMLGHAWLVCGDTEKAEAYLQKTDDLRVNGDIPEAYVYKDGEYVPCEHTPLLWCHALALSLRRQLDERSKVSSSDLKPTEFA